MNFMFSVFFAGGIAAFVYSKMGRRLGYGNGQSVWGIVAISFVLSLIFFYTLITYVIHL